MKNKILMFLLTIIAITSISCAKTSNAQNKLQKLQLVEIQTDETPTNDGWIECVTYVGILNLSNDFVSFIPNMRVGNVILETEEGKDYPVTVEIGGRYSVYPDYELPFEDFATIPPGFKLYSFGNNPTYITLHYKYAKAATPKRIVFSKDKDEQIIETYNGYELNTNIDLSLSNNPYLGTNMMYSNVIDQPIKTLSSLKSTSIPMEDEQLVAQYTGQCLYREKDQFGYMLSEPQYFAEVSVRNTDKFDEYRPESELIIGYYNNGEGKTTSLNFASPGIAVKKIPPGGSKILYFELVGNVLILEDFSSNNYFVLDYSDCVSNTSSIEAPESSDEVANYISTSFDNNDAFEDYIDSQNRGYFVVDNGKLNAYVDLGIYANTNAIDLVPDDIIVEFDFQFKSFENHMAAGAILDFDWDTNKGVHFKINVLNGVPQYAIFYNLSGDTQMLKYSNFKPLPEFNINQENHVKITSSNNYFEFFINGEYIDNFEIQYDQSADQIGLFLQSDTANLLAEFDNFVVTPFFVVE